MKRKSLWLSIGSAISLLAIVAVACGSAEEEAVTKDELAAALQQAVAAAAPAAPAPAPAGVSATEMKALVEAAVSSASGDAVTAAQIEGLVAKAVESAAMAGPTPLTSAEIKGIVSAAVSSATGDAVTAAEIESLVAKAVESAAMAGPAPLTAADVQGIVSAAIAVPVAAPAPVPVGWLLRAPEANPKRGGQVRTAWRTFTSNTDIHQGGQENILTNFYNNLIRFNPADGLRTIIPDLAESWDVAADGNSYTFNLRKGVQFSDGTPFRAEDVVATFNRIIFPPAGIVSVRQSRYDAIGKVEALGPYEVRFTLAKPRVWQFDVLNGPDAIIYSKKSLEENDNDLRKVIAPGTGPFKFVERQVDEFWLFEPNPLHWNPNLPYVDEVKMLNIFGWSDRGIAVLTGIADFSWNAAPDTLVEARKRPDIHTATPFIFASVGIAMNAEKAPFTDPRVRRAIHLALNRHDLVSVYRTALDFAHVSRWMSPGSTCAQSNDEVYSIPGYRVDNTADIAEAQRLLAEAGFPNGEGMRTLEQVNHTQAAHLGVLAPAFNEQLKTNLNINMTIRAVEVAVLPEVYKQDYDFVAWGTPVNPIPDITPLWEGNWKTGGSQNHGNYSNADFDAVVDGLSSELDPLKRCALYREGQDILDADPPQFLWGFTSHGAMWGDQLHGLALDQRVMSEWGRFDTVWLDR